MKKIFMCVNYPSFNPAIGISKKIRSQIDTFQTIGYDVTYSAYLEDGVAIFENGEIVLKEEYLSFFPKNINNKIKFFYLMSICFRYLKGKKFDLGFIRWSAIDSSFLRVIKRMKENCGTVIMDCHGYFPNYDPPSVVGKYIKKKTIRHSAELNGLVDLILTETKQTTIFGIQAMPMDTGIDVDKYTPHKYIGNEQEIHMISVSNEQEYHGYDRIIRGIAVSNNANVFLHLVGRMSEKTSKLISELNLENKIFLHGYQTGTALDEIYSKCNIGVGPLAPHRIGGKEGTGIKTKEYFALGLPYFYAGQELLVPDEYPYVYKVPANDSLINVDEIIEFYNRIKDDKKMVESMRCFARENYSWVKIFSTALNKLGLLKE